MKFVVTAHAEIRVLRARLAAHNSVTGIVKYGSVRDFGTTDNDKAQLISTLTNK